MTDAENQKNDEEVVKINKPEFSSPKMQESRAFLRERFLRFMTGSVGKNCKNNIALKWQNLIN